MRYLAQYEDAQRGTFDFPVAKYYVDAEHPRYEMPFHWHEECELIRVRSGTFPLLADANPLMLMAGDFAFVPGGEIHGGRPHDAVYECLVLNMERLLQVSGGRWEQYVASLGNGRRIQRRFSYNSEAGMLLGQLFNVMESKQPGYEFFSIGLLWQWLGLVIKDELFHDVTPPNSRHTLRAEQLKHVLRRIRRDYAQPLTLSELADEAGLHPQYFCRIFRQTMGKTPVDYLNYYRAECAAEMLRITDTSVTDIALACGFNDLSYFIRLFRRYKGVSPKQYRRAIENENSSHTTGG